MRVFKIFILASLFIPLLLTDRAYCSIDDRIVTMKVQQGGAPLTKDEAYRFAKLLGYTGPANRMVAIGKLFNGEILTNRQFKYLAQAPNAQEIMDKAQAYLSASQRIYFLDLNTELRHKSDCPSYDRTSKWIKCVKGMGTPCPDCIQSDEDYMQTPQTVVPFPQAKPSNIVRTKLPSSKIRDDGSINKSNIDFAIKSLWNFYSESLKKYVSIDTRKTPLKIWEFWDWFFSRPEFKKATSKLNSVELSELKKILISDREASVIVPEKDGAYITRSLQDKTAETNWLKLKESKNPWDFLSDLSDSEIFRLACISFDERSLLSSSLKWHLMKNKKISALDDKTFCFGREPNYDEVLKITEKDIPNLINIAKSEKSLLENVLILRGIECGVIGTSSLSDAQLDALSTITETLMPKMNAIISTERNKRKAQ